MYLIKSRTTFCILKDILSMEEEQEQLRKRIDRVRKRVYLMFLML